MNDYAKRKDSGGLCGKISKALWCQSDSHLVNSVYGVGFIFGQFVFNLMSILFANICSFCVMCIYHVLTIGFVVLRYMCRLGCIVVV